MVGLDASRLRLPKLFHVIRHGRARDECRPHNPGNFDRIAVAPGPVMLEKPSYPAVRGVFMIGMAKVLRFRRAEALQLVAPHLRTYFVQHVSPAFWYPEEDFVGLADAVAKLHPHIDDVYGMLGATGARIY